MNSPAKQFLIDTIWDLLETTGLYRDLLMESKEDVPNMIPDEVVERFDKKLSTFKWGKMYTRLDDPKETLEHTEPVAHVKLETPPREPVSEQDIWWDHHLTTCGTKFRGCDPKCPKEIHEQEIIKKRFEKNKDKLDKWVEENK